MCTFSHTHLSCLTDSLCNLRNMTFQAIVHVITYVCACMLSHFSHVWLFVIPWTIAHQPPLPMGFSRHEYWNGLPFPPPGDLFIPGIKSMPFMSPVLTGRFFTASATWGVVQIMRSKLKPRLVWFQSTWFHQYSAISHTIKNDMLQNPI